MTGSTVSTERSPLTPHDGSVARHRRNGRLPLAATLLTLPLLALSGCGGSGTENQPVTTTTPAGQSTAPTAAAARERDHALVRMIHTVPAGAAVDLFADDVVVFRGIDYKTTTPYQELEGARHRFRLRPAGMSTAAALAENSEGLSNGTHYTIVALPGQDDAPAALRVIDDDVQRPDTGQARLRIIHASRDARQVDVFAQGHATALFPGLAFQTVTDYQPVAPASTILEVRADGARDAMLVLPAVRFEAGKSYTIVLVGQLRSAPKLEALVIEDQVGPPTPAGS